ncbi:hypothetical protein evm_010552 [Chilo suppressalis]|nr:hypothetical protein evm_010552 [Chilo suppressalis]
MEVGAVKQAFNNELILLKKKLNQAKIQIIHKLTRKAKTFTEKKAPEPLKEKLKRKAESAVKEVLIIKKIQPKDLARFAVTHKGQLNDYLNKPNVDQDKACARLLLHKSLQDKYKLIRTRFCSIPIEDLLMSREERKKLKKEAKEKQKNKKKGKENKLKEKDVVNAEGVWKVEDMNVSGSVKECSDNEQSDIEEVISEGETETVQNSEEGSVQQNTEEFNSNESDIESNNSQDEKHSDTAPTSSESENEKDDTEDDIDATKTASNTKQVKFLKLKSRKKLQIQDIGNVKKVTEVNFGTPQNLPQKNPVMNSKDKSKSNKNKNLNEKLLSRKFKKDSVEAPVQETKIVDPFFITSSGENYLSVVEPRPPDEVKEVHKQGNRKLRRAVLFGHVPKIKPRQHTFEADGNRFSKQNGFNKNNNSNRYNNREDFSNDKRNVTNKRKIFESTEQQESKPEKLHPSWEAKKRQSGIQPFKVAGGGIRNMGAINPATAVNASLLRRGSLPGGRRYC